MKSTSKKIIVKPEKSKILKNCHNCAHVEYDSCDCSDYGCSHGSYAYCTKEDNKTESRSEKMLDEGYCKKGKKCFEEASRAQNAWRNGEVTDELDDDQED